VYIDILFLFTFIMYSECHCFNSVLMFFTLFYFIIDVLKSVDSGLWMYIQMIIENHLPIKGQKYEWRCVCVFWSGYKYKRDALSEAAVTLRTVVTFVTCLISRTEFPV